METMRSIIVLTTGGTIASKEVEGRGAVPILKGEELLAGIPAIGRYAQVKVQAFANIPGAHMSLDRIVELAGKAEELLGLPDVHGLVITHGTDTMEETAYFLDLTLLSLKPVVFTGAMRTPSEVSFDGSRNLLDAVRVAASPEAAGLGVLVVMNGEIHEARWATKVHSQRLDAFRSPFYGPLGMVDDEGVVLYRRPSVQRVRVEKRIEPKVDLIKLALGSDDKFIRCAVEAGAKGIVIEAFGGGRVPPQVIPALEEAVKQGVVMVVTTRCLGGRLGDPYGYEGASGHLRRIGLIFGHDLSGPKGRIKLMVALANFPTKDEIKAYLES